MPLFVIERTVPGAGELAPEALGNIARTSCDAMARLDSSYDWKHSYVVDDKFFCVHEAESEEAVRRHAELGGFPVDRVYEVRAVINPETGKDQAVQE